MTAAWAVSYLWQYLGSSHCFEPCSYLFLTLRSCFNCEHGGEKDRGDRGRDRFQRFYQCKERQGCDERNSHNQNSKRSFIRTLQEPEEKTQDILDFTEPMGTATCMTKHQVRASNDIGSGDRGPRRDFIGKDKVTCVIWVRFPMIQNYTQKKLFHMASSTSNSKTQVLLHLKILSCLVWRGSGEEVKCHHWRISSHKRLKGSNQVTQKIPPLPQNNIS